MRYITSRQNPEIKNLDRLTSTKGRREQKRFIAEGLRTVETLLSSYTPLMLYVTESFYATHRLPVAVEFITLVSESVMEKISTQSSAPGICGVFPIPEMSTEYLSSGIVLANITNPGNMGTLIRTAAAMGKKTIITLQGVDIWSPKVIHAAAGAHAFVHIYQMSLTELIAKKESIPLCALIVQNGALPETVPLQQSLIVIGNEAEGISPELLSHCRYTCTLPMPGHTESLNAAIAGSIALYLARE